MGLPLHDTTKTFSPPPSLLKGVKKEDYPPVTVMGNLSLTQSLDLALTRFNLNYPSFRDLNAIYSVGTGLSAYELVELFGKSKGSYVSLHYRLNLLLSKGLIYRQDNRYYPTDLCIEEFGKLLG